MRGLVILALFATFLPTSWLWPHIGLMIWGWFTIMNPHRESWGFAAELPFGLVAAAITIIVWLVSRERKWPVIGTLPVLMVMFLFCMFAAQNFSLRPDYSFEYFDLFLREWVFQFLVLCLIDRKTRLHSFVWLFVLCIGYFGIVGGIRTIVYAGTWQIYGPEQSMLYDNNHLGLAFVVILPLINYLRMHTVSGLIRLGLLGLMVLTLIGIIGTDSRGAFIALCVMAVLFWWQSDKKLMSALAFGVVAIPLVVTFAPQSWYERIDTISEYKEDASFQGRVDAWVIAIEIAKERPLVGAGFRVPYLQSIADRYLDEYRKARAAHSIYFEVLGSMGVFALMLFLGMMLSTYLSLRRIMKVCRDDPAKKWAHDLASMMMISFLSFAVGGAAVSMEWWTGFWLMMTLSYGLHHAVVEQQVRVPERGHPSAHSSLASHRPASF